MKNGVLAVMRAMTKAQIINAGRVFASSMSCPELLVVLCLLTAVATGQAAQAGKRDLPNRVAYACVMHSDVRSAQPGKCPKCGMALREAGEVSDATTSNGNSAGPRAQIPDATVYDQEGRRLHFYSDLVRGKTVAINFIFTTCTTICPPLTATFRRVQQLMGERAGKDVHLISISVDPATDVPERLKEFAGKFKAGPGWTFVTGSKPEIDRLLASLGGAVADKNDHTPMILVGNDSAHFWTRTYGLAPASQIASLLTDAVSRSAASSKHESPPDGPQERAGAKTQGVSRVEAEKAVTTPAEAAARYFPNTLLLTQDNRPVHFYDDLMKNRVVLINFLFTTCKGVCSPMTANLARVQKNLGARVGRDVNIISISVDPETDTPAVLKKYAESFHAQPGWYFLTGQKRDVDAVLYKLGGYVEDKQQHSSVLIIGNTRTGEWMKVFAMANPAEIAETVTKLLDSKPEAN